MTQELTEPPQASLQEERVTVSFCARRLGVSSASVIRLIESEELRAIRVGNVYRVLPSDLLAYEESKSTQK